MLTFFHIIGALLFIAAIIFVFIFSFWLLDEFTDFYDTPFDENTGAKLLLFIPWMIVLLWCLILCALGGIFVIIGMANIATEARNWWHKAK